MRVWIDIENPPQVQYLLPLRAAFERLGAEVVVTARDYGNTFELLGRSGAPYVPVGASYGSAKWRKATGLAGRSAALVRHLVRSGRPDASVSASRAAAVAGRLLRHPSFVIVDYEYVSLGVFRLSGSRLLHPDAIPSGRFVDRGVGRDRLIPFRGLKEDISFAGIDVEGTPAHELPRPELVRALVRPAAEESHYYREESGRMTAAILERLAAEERALVVFAPRYPRQAAYLERLDWRNEPILLDRAVPFVSLLKAVDLVISSGGTMLREAAYLGVPAYSTFGGEIGGVDRRLAELGRLHLLAGAGDLGRIAIEKAGPLRPLESNPGLADELAALVLGRASPNG